MIDYIIMDGHVTDMITLYLKKMKSNLDKWIYYLSILNDKTNKFIEKELEGKYIPDKIYSINHSGGIQEKDIVGVNYNHLHHKQVTYLTRKPTNAEVERLRNYAESDIPFERKNISFDTVEKFGDNHQYTAKSTVTLSNLINEIGLFHKLEDAELSSQKIIKERKETQDFYEEHKKDASYNYNGNGYKFLGWQNGWNHVYLDEDGKLCSESNKPRVCFTYLEEDHPEYGKCVRLKHRLIEVRHNQRGTENTVSCPICKIYWKYDCSD